MKALIFGGGGMLARDLVRALHARGHVALPLDHATGNVTDPAAVREAVAATTPDMVFNCAAYTKVDQAEAEPALAFAVNAAGARNVAAAAADRGIPVVHVSTDYVFAGSRVEGYCEWDGLNPLSVYGRSKALGEFQVRGVNPRHLIVRSQWLFGAGGPNFVRTMLKLGREHDTLDVVDDQVGCPTYTPDLALALVALAEAQARGTYHVTNSGSCSWKQFAEVILRVSGLPATVRPTTTERLARPAPRPLQSVLVNQMWRADGRPPLRHHEAALAEYLQQQGEG